MDPKSQSTASTASELAITTADLMKSDPNSEADFLAQTELSRSALQFLAGVMKLDNPPDDVILSSFNQIMKTTVWPLLILY